MSFQWPTDEALARRMQERLHPDLQVIWDVFTETSLFRTTRGLDALRAFLQLQEILLSSFWEKEPDLELTLNMVEDGESLAALVIPYRPKDRPVFLGNVPTKDITGLQGVDVWRTWKKKTVHLWSCRNGWFRAACNKTATRAIAPKHDSGVPKECKICFASKGAPE